jgi:hypothetical protein
MHFLAEYCEKHEVRLLLPLKFYSCNVVCLTLCAGQPDLLSVSDGFSELEDATKMPLTQWSVDFGSISKVQHCLLFSCLKIMLQI